MFRGHVSLGLFCMSKFTLIGILFCIDLKPFSGSFFIRSIHVGWQIVVVNVSLLCNFDGLIERNFLKGSEKRKKKTPIAQVS
jgi:hypothetical protein